MLTSLSIKDYVLIEDASLEFGSGLTVLSGETGAGKTLLTQALGLLLGERAGDGLVSELSQEALIQGVLELSESQLAEVPADTRDLLDLEAGELVVTRRLSRVGKNRCFLNGVAVPLGVLSEALGDLISFSGQHEHRRLLKPSHQLQVLDAFAGSDQTRDRQEYRACWVEARSGEARLDALRRGVAERRRESELLRFQVQELEAAALEVCEERELEVEQRRLSRIEEMARACAAAAGCLRSDDVGADVGGLVSAARSGLTPFLGLDPRLDDSLASLSEADGLIDDVARTLHTLMGSLEPDPARLNAVDERLRVYSDMAKKYEGTTEAAIAFLAEASERLRSLETSEQDLSEMTRHVAERRGRCLELAAELSKRRVEAAARLQAAVRPHLVDLGMAEGTAPVSVESRQGWDALDADGADSVEFLLAANVGVEARSLARTASGGELSRVLLAIKTALRGCETAETVVFDEIDAGVGGLTATAVGAKLRETSRNCQVIVVTHLAQVAAFADRHYLIRKEVAAGRSVTSLQVLDGQGSLEELARMLGGAPGDQGALALARSLKHRAEVGLID
ncbi:MAG TPA: DNA repair protein RecN [Thermoleophilia bacterium]|nr:DNA repair protein RecN [Thermoleophilia bacterium]